MFYDVCKSESFVAEHNSVSYQSSLLNYRLKCSAIVLKACTGKKDRAATMKMTANVITPNVTVSVFNVPALSGTNFFRASSPAIATWPTIGKKRPRIRTIPQE